MDYIPITIMGHDKPKIHPKSIQCASHMNRMTHEYMPTYSSNYTHKEHMDNNTKDKHTTEPHQQEKYTQAATVLQLKDAIIYTLTYTQ